MNCYKIKVKTTNSSNDTFHVKRNENDEISEYFDCEDSIIYVVTDAINKIFEKFGDEVIIYIEKIGIGYLV